MRRISINPRKDFKEIIEEQGFFFSPDYWKEDAYYSFSLEEIKAIEKATNECYSMFVDAVQYVIDNNLWNKLHIPQFMIQTLIDSWENDELSLYGRFDFAMKNGVPKLLEFNADTPTSLLEAAIIQWYWKCDKFPNNDQFNSIHEALVESWDFIHRQYQADKYHFACIKDNLEDYSNTAYILSTAHEAGLSTVMMDLDDITLYDEGFFNLNHAHLDILFKLYPYEWMFHEEFGQYIPTCNTTFIEPLWKAIMSNKYMLVILSKLFPDSPYILKCSERTMAADYCKKPIYSREGANVTLIKDGEVLEETEGEYGEEGYIYQELVELESFDGKYPILGSWIVGGCAHGMGIRETSSRITDNMANFVPHIIE